MSKRNMKVLGQWGPNGQRVIAAESYWRNPIKWNAEAKAAGERRRVFCASLADVGEGPETMPDSAWIDVQAARTRMSVLIMECDHLDFLLLTKRPRNMTRYFDKPVLERCWIGTSCENQQAADERIPHLLRCPAAVRFISAEPLLGPLDLMPYLTRLFHNGVQRGDRIDWVIVGGESGPGARPCNVAWVRSIVEQCKAASVAVFVKQLGKWIEGDHNFDGWQGVIDRFLLRDERSEAVWKRPILRSQFNPEIFDSRPSNAVAWGLNDPKGGDPSEWPTDLRVREFPEVKP